MWRKMLKLQTRFSRAGEEEEEEGGKTLWRAKEK